MTKTDLEQIAIAAAKSQGIDPALVCALITNESSWNIYAARYETGFYARYIEPMKDVRTFGPTITQITERVQRATSFGLMQVMGEVAREYGYTAEFLSGLHEPADNTAIGCLRLKRALVKANGVVSVALLDWNGGGNANYPDRVLQHYKDYAYLNAGAPE